MVDITAPVGVDVVISEDEKVLWVNIDGVCVLRICQIPRLDVSLPSRYGFVLRSNRSNANQ